MSTPEALASRCTAWPMRLARPVLVAGLALAVCACSTGSALPDPSTAPMAASHVSGRYVINIDDLASLLPKVASDLTWAVVRTDNQVTALRADLVTADGRPVEVRAQQVGRPAVEVEVRYGHWGDTDKEAAFHAALARRIAETTATTP